MLDAGCWMLDAGCGLKKQVQKEKRGNYGLPYFGGGGFCSFEKAKVVKWLKVGRLCAAGYRIGIKEMIGRFGLCFLLWDISRFTAQFMLGDWKYIRIFESYLLL